MSKRKAIMFISFVLIISTILSGCSNIVRPRHKDLAQEEESDVVDDVDNNTSQDELNLGENFELNLGDKTIMDKEEFETIYKNNPEMLSYINEFVGKLAPDFKMTDLDGNDISLSDFKGEGLVVEFMGTWCPVCKEAAPIINQFNNKYDDIKIISVSINETTEDLKTFLDEEKISYEHYYIPQEDSIMDLYGLRFVPTFFYIDKEGYVQMILGGNPPSEMLDDLYHRIYK